MSASEAPALCNQCSRIFQGSFETTLWASMNPHHVSVASLACAANTNCFICKTLWKKLSKLSDLETEMPSGDADASVHSITAYTFTSKTFYFRFPSHPLLDYVHFHYGETQLDHQTQHSYSPLSTASTSNLEAPKKWLPQCLETHSKCQAAELVRARSLRKASAMRLLYIEDNDRVRLLMEPLSDIASAPRYATLSHCWGPDEFFKLTDTTKYQLIEGIPTSILSQTFQDAIFTAKTLGLQHIWIDSLCIFQDSKKDWEEQAPRMYEVYKHAVLSIAANASAKGSSGCFRTREAGSMVTCEIKTSWDDRTNGIFQIYHSEIWPEAFDDQPLMRRAWVVQELRLPPRILHFNSNQMFWQCYEHLVCEELPTTMSADLETTNFEEQNYQFNIYEHHHRPSEIDQTIPILCDYKFWHAWHDLLERYTKCHLTFVKDRLIAISGMAKLFREPLSSTYCAGLWKRRFPIELLWERNVLDSRKPAPPKALPEIYRAPSWSWASIDEPVLSSRISKSSSLCIYIMVELRSCKVTTKTDDAFSEVLDGVLRLSGFFTKMELRSSSAMNFDTYIDGERLYDSTYGSPRIILDYKPADVQDMFCLPILLHHRWGYWSLECLIIVAAEDGTATFKRVGRLIISVDGLLRQYSYHKLGGDAAHQEARGIGEFNTRDSDWHRFVLSWSERCSTYAQSFDWLEYETLAVSGAVELSIV